MKEPERIKGVVKAVKPVREAKRGYTFGILLDDGSWYNFFDDSKAITEQNFELVKKNKHIEFAYYTKNNFNIIREIFEATNVPYETVKDDPDWTSIKAEKQDKIFKNMCFNASISLFSGMFTYEQLASKQLFEEYSDSIFQVALALYMKGKERGYS